ncbi:MAG: amylo-alpha-1,6-glucosidase [Tepidisphaeraceae bacterium]|jgi:predicted glycogen debranching enzyme
MSLYAIETYGELRPHIEEEWLLTNGLGTYAAGTVVGCNTRRYHGLLCAATTPPVGRVMLLNRVGEILVVDGDESRLLEFSINQFFDRFHPRGDRYLQRFELNEGFAQWKYEVEGIRVIKQVQVPWKMNVAGVRYTVVSERPVELRLLPFMRLLDFHHLRRGQANFQGAYEEKSVWVKDGANRVSIVSDNGSFVCQPDWWFSHIYSVETERGLDDTEDLYTPGHFSLKVSGTATITLWASAGEERVLDWEAQLERRRRAASPLPWKNPSPTVAGLARAGGDFVVSRKSPDERDGSTIIAGYPWFADWGRDTMISLPGLLLTTGRFEEAKQVLSVFAQYVSEGMIPNRFDDNTNEPSYNTVDASLWFIHAAFEYARLSGDQKTMGEVLRPACEAIVAGYTRGTRFKIGVDPADGLVTQGDFGTQLTWMDAKTDGVAFTPRQGKAVEINALWFNALKLLGNESEAQRVAGSFRKAFWISPFRGLADVVDGPRRDVAVRPNQIFAVSLRHSPLLHEEQAAVVETVKRELLTPVGLRTLSRNDPKYHGVYRGSQRKRDEAYHNGTVWPWLLGAFLEAYLRVNQRSAQSQDQARRWLSPLIETMQKGCIGQIAEIFEGNEPHRACGCFAQAWSVAETLRLAVELGL